MTDGLRVSVRRSQMDPVYAFARETARTGSIRDPVKSEAGMLVRTSCLEMRDARQAVSLTHSFSERSEQVANAGRRKSRRAADQSW